MGGQDQTLKRQATDKADPGKAHICVDGELVLRAHVEDGSPAQGGTDVSVLFVKRDSFERYNATRRGAE